MGLYTLYLDDSRWEKDGIRYLCWAGYIVEESQEHNLFSGFRQIKTQNGLNEFDPVKFNPPNKPEYSPQRRIPSQKGFKEQVLNYLASSGVTCLGGLIEQNGQVAFDLMARQLIEDIAVRLQFFLQDQIRDNGASASSRGCMIAAYPATNQSKIFSDQYNSIMKASAKATSSSFLRSASQYTVKLTKLEEGLYFSYEPHNLAIQLADFVASSCLFTLKTGKRNYFDIIKPVFREKNGYIKGAGLTVQPSNSRIVDKIIG